MFAFFVRFSRMRIIIGLVLGAALVVAGVMLFNRPDAPESAITVIRGPISEIVSVTGQLEPVQSVELSFQSGGRITQVSAAVGDIVTPGRVLAVIDNAENNARLRDAQAGLAIQQAKLDELRRGALQEEIAAVEAEFAREQQTYQAALDNVPDVLLDAYTYALNAIRVQLDGIFEQSGTDDFPVFRMTFGCATCGNERYDAQDLRAASEVGLNDWKELMDGLAEDETALTAALAEARGYAETGRNLLTLLDIILNSSGVGLEDDVQQDYREQVSAGKTAIVASLNSLNAQSQYIVSQKYVVKRVTSELAVMRSGATTEQLRAQEAAVLSAQAQVTLVQAAISTNIIRSPINGTVTRMEAKVGQSAAPNTPLIAVVSVGNLEMTANVPEVDVGKVAVGNRIDFTVDALPGESFTASVSYIDPAETVIDGVVNYRITAALPESDGRLKSGLTVNMDIRTRFKADALILPQYAVIQNDDGTFVERLEGASTQRTPVTLGLRSDDGMVEVVSGVNEGDRVANVGLKQ